VILSRILEKNLQIGVVISQLAKVLGERISESCVARLSIYTRFIILYYYEKEKRIERAVHF